MSTWQQFLTITTKLDEIVHSPTEKRSHVVEEVERLLEEREAIMYELPQPTEAEKPLLEEVKKRDLKINQKLEFLFNDLKRDMRNNKKQKASKKQYTNPYQNVSSYDGMFLDSKK
ncbi:flagellar protein FliT [Halobacillus locisalis]|uniref:Flagellar protein FliT n=1 Tax=Halobacillus locisalis TaxID=220753 RepID=A0A838CUJ7_9BACI|nr:flagellar protein FliT [Halobacillus locisalis]